MKKPPKSTIVKLCVAACSATVTLFLLEAGTRLLRPEVNLQHSTRAMFMEDVFGDTYGYRPNAVGKSFDAAVHIDGNGFRAMPALNDVSDSWLILGDSVAFGVGVRDDETFVWGMQTRSPDTKMWNTSAVGYASPHYLDIIASFVNKDSNISRAVLFLCLNDAVSDKYGLGTRRRRNAARQLLVYLREHSYFYMWAKGLLFDRSMQGFHDIARYYREEDRYFKDLVANIATMAELTSAHGIDFTVVVLPFEYQLRKGSEDSLQPQRLLRAHLEKRQIRCIDLYEGLRSASSGDRSEFLYLFADPAHFSKAGHQQVSKLMAGYFGKPDE
jgi:hypothetical protein